MFSNEPVWMVIAVYLPSCLFQLSSGSVAKIWQSVSVHAERGNKLDGNYGLGFFRMASKNAWDEVIWKWKRECGSSWTFKVPLCGSVVVNSQFTPPPSQHLLCRQTPSFFSLPSCRQPFFSSRQTEDAVSEISVMKVVSLHHRLKDKPLN